MSFEEFGLRLRRAGRRKNTRSEWMPATSIHETERGKAIEPGVGDALDQPGPIYLRKLPQRRDLGANVVR